MNDAVAHRVPKVNQRERQELVNDIAEKTDRLLCSTRSTPAIHPFPPEPARNVPTIHGKIGRLKATANKERHVRISEYIIR